MVAFDSSSPTQKPLGCWSSSRRSVPASIAASSAVSSCTTVMPRSSACIALIVRAAARPLRTAPSIVAGQPVSVHAPARTTSGRSVCRSAPLRARSRAEGDGRVRLAADTRPEEVRVAEPPGELARHQVDETLAADVEQVGDSARHDRQVLAPLGRVAGQRAAVEDPVRRRAEQRGERRAEKRPIEEQVHGDDRRRLERRLGLRRGAAPTRPAAARRRSRRRRARRGSRPARRSHRRARRLERASRRVAVHGPERPGGQDHVGGGRLAEKRRPHGEDAHAPRSPRRRAG